MTVRQRLPLSPALRRRGGWFALALAALQPASAAEPIVIGQSLSNGAGSYRAATALNQGALALVGRVNAQGGINGRPLKLVVLDGGNDPASHAANVRTLVQDHKAVAIIGCAGDAVCRASAAAAAQLRVPLVGALSGSSALARDANAWSFTVRPPYAREAEALARQLHTLGVTRTALLSDTSGERAAALKQALEASGIAVSSLALSAGDATSVERATTQVGAGRFQAAVLDVRPDTVDALAACEAHQPAKWPRTIVSPASSALNGIGNLFRHHVVGYSQVVPNPDADSMPLTVEMQHSAEAYASGKALNFDGMATYIAAKVTAAAIQRAGSRVDGESVAAALLAMDGLDLGGYTVSFSRGRKTGSDWVGIGMRSRDGIYLK